MRRTEGTRESDVSHKGCTHGRRHRLGLAPFQPWRLLDTRKSDQFILLFETCFTPAASPDTLSRTLTNILTIVRRPSPLWIVKNGGPQGGKDRGKGGVVIPPPFFRIASGQRPAGTLIITRSRTSRETLSQELCRAWHRTIVQLLLCQLVNKKRFNVCRFLRRRLLISFVTRKENVCLPRITDWLGVHVPRQLFLRVTRQARTGDKFAP